MRPVILSQLLCGSSFNNMKKECDVNAKAFWTNDASLT